MIRVLILISFCFSTLTACSRLDIAFDWADTYIASKVDDYFDISSGQSKSLKKSLQRDFQELKSKILPQWITSAKKVETDVSQGTLTREKISSIYSQVMENVSRLPSYFSRTAVEFISTTNSEQIDYFKKYFSKKNTEDLQKLRDAPRLQSEYREKYFKYFKMFLGDLTQDQVALIEKHLQEGPFPIELKVKNKERVFQTFLKASSSSDSLKGFVQTYYSSSAEYDLPEYHEAFRKYQAHLETLVIDVLLTLTPQQKNELRRNLQEKVTQLERIYHRS